MNEKISIVVASYNKLRYIEESINSVIAQTYSNWELLIIDDGSNDGTASFVESNYSDSRILLFKLIENRGANYCRNLGIEKSNGSYIIFLDADDILDNYCLERRLKAALNYPKSNLIVFSMGVFYKTVGDDKRTWLPTSRNPLSDFLQHKLPWSILQPLWKKALLLEIKGFDESFNRLQDVELSTRALLSDKVQLVMVGGEPDCYYRIDESRKNFEIVSFLERWIDASLLYYNKFIALTNTQKRNYLFGTVFETYLQLMHRLKCKQITKTQFKELEMRLLNGSISKSVNPIKAILLACAKINNTGPIKLPGLNSFLKKVLMLR